jgi:hypothetical protein
MKTVRISQKQLSFHAPLHRSSVLSKTESRPGPLLTIHDSHSFESMVLPHLRAPFLGRCPLRLRAGGQELARSLGPRLSSRRKGLP